MRRILVCTCMAGLLLAGCGGKKRAARNSNEGALTTTTPSRTEAYPLPEDPGKFVYISTESPEEYIRTFSSIAQHEMKEYGIPASITLAQGLLESGFGKGALTRKTNNHFGIKCHTGWEGDYERHDDDARGECFRKYNHPMYSYRDHSIFLSSRSRYAGLFRLKPDDYRKWAHGLKAAGYATDRRYPHKLIELIERYGLQHFDAEVLRQGGIAVAVEPPVRDYSEYYVQAGDTLYAISRRYSMSVEELMQVNGLRDSSLAIGQVLRVRTDNTRK